MKQVFLAYNQIVKMKINVIGLKKLLVGICKAALVLNISKHITAKGYQVKREIVDSRHFNVLNRPFVHSFPVLEYSILEKPILGDFWTFDIYVNGNCVLSRKRSGAIICERKRFVERRIADYLYRYLNYQVKHFSGPNNPDLILKDPLCDSEIQCEITEKTNSKNELTYKKFSQDVEKYERYKRENRFPNVKHLLIISCSKGINHKIKKHLRDYITILTFNDLFNLLVSLKKKQDGILNKEKVKNIISNPGIQKAPKIYRKIFTPYMKESTITPYVLDLRQRSSTLQLDQSLLYIRDINPFEIVKILEIAKINKDNYITKSKFKKILLRPDNLKLVNERRPDASQQTNKYRISKEWWLITPIQLGYLDEDCGITDKGLFLLELVERRNQEMLRKAMGYDFLSAPGVKEFLKLANKTYNDSFYLRSPSKASFYKVLSRRMKGIGLSSSEANARKDCDNLFRWLRIFEYSDSYFLNVDRIKEDYILEARA